MTDEELSHAHSAARAAAAAVRPPPPQSRPRFHPSLHIDTHPKEEAPPTPEDLRPRMIIQPDSNPFHETRLHVESSRSDQSFYEEAEPGMMMEYDSDYATPPHSHSSDLLTPHSQARPNTGVSSHSSCSEDAHPPVTPPTYAADHKPSSSWQTPGTSKVMDYQHISRTDLLLP